MPFLRTLGSLALEGVETATLSSRRKAVVLLAYLARRAPRPVSRAQLATLLWEDRTESKARQSLRQVLLELKRVAPASIELHEEQVVGGSGLETDVALFEADLTAGRLWEAVERWSGDFLAGAEDVGGESFRAWLEAERESLRRDLARAYDSLVEEAERRGATGEVRRAAERWARALPLDERAQRALAQALQHEGRAAEAVHVLQEFAARLRAELEVEPSGDLTRCLTELEELARQSARGAPGSVAVFTPDLVGRGPALAELAAAWETALRGEPIGVLLEGESGAGKSRLAEEFVRSVERSGVAVALRLRGRDPLGEPALAMARELSVQLADAPGISGASASALGELASLAPALRDRFPTLPAGVGDEPALETALVEALTAVAEERPVLLWTDDFPLLDETSQRVLLGVTGRARGRLLYLICARSDESPNRAVAALHARTAVRRLPLQPLDVADVDVLLASMLVLDAEERAALAWRLHAAAGGNPLHTIELAVGLIDEGALAPTPQGRWRITPGAEGQLPLPETLREALRRRLVRLSAPARAFAEAAAVFGAEFDARAAAELAGLVDGEAESALHELVGRRLLRRGFRGGDNHEFAHPLVQRVAYEAIAPERRRALHADAARLLAESSSTSAPAAAARHRRLAAEAPARPRAARVGRRVQAAAALVAGVIGVLALRSVLHVRATPHMLAPSASARADPRPAIAVLYLDNLSPDTLDEYLTQGLTEEITSTLGHIPRLRVKSRNAARRLRTAGTADPAEIGRVLAVHYFVEGSIRRVGERIRVSVRLVNADDGFQLWSRDYDAGKGNLFALESSIAREVASAVTGQLTPGEQARLARLPTQSPAAYDHYLRGNFQLLKRTPRAIGRAIEEYAAAVQLDSGFTTALARLAYTYALFLDWGWDYPGLSDGQLMRQALAITDRMLRGDSSSAEAWSARGYLLSLQHPRTLEGSVDAFERAVALDSTNAEAYHQLGQVLMVLGRDGEALAAYHRALALEPDRPTTLVGVAAIHWRARRLAEGRRWADSAVAVSASVPAPYTRAARGVIELTQGRPDEARRDAEAALQMDTSYAVPARSVLAAALAHLGDSAGARVQVELVVYKIGSGTPSPTDARFVASAMVALGQYQRAIRVLERARPRGAWLWFYLQGPDFDPVRSARRFQAIVAEARP